MEEKRFLDYKQKNVLSDMFAKITIYLATVLLIQLMLQKPFATKPILASLLATLILGSLAVIIAREET